MNYDNLMTNMDKDVFIPIVPSVLGAMLMSKVSRQKEGFREDLIKLVDDDMINLPKDNQLEQFKNSVVVANGFMEKWGVNYGHSSIKELDTLQMCIENKSRWFTEILETLLPSKYMSYIEYSLRYNPPKDYYIPTELEADEELKSKYIEYSDGLFDTYNSIYEDFYQIVVDRYPELSDREKRLKAFENARNVLPLSTKANMGMQSNLRAFCDAISEMNAYEGINSEIFETSNTMKEEALKVSVGMVKHAEATEYLKSLIQNFYEREEISSPYKVYEEPEVYVDSEIIGRVEKLKRYGKLDKMGRFDRLPNSFRSIGKNVEVIMSEAAHHQFIRHRAFDFLTKLPDVKYGYIMPYEISTLNPKNDMSEAVLTAREKIKQAYNKSVEIYELLDSKKLLNLAPYVVLNCNARSIEFFGSLFAMTNFVTLRKEAHAQDEIRIVANVLDECFKDLESLIPNYKNDRG